jgi:hypothetical protein
MGDTMSIIVGELDPAEELSDLIEENECLREEVKEWKDWTRVTAATLFRERREHQRERNALVNISDQSDPNCHKGGWDCDCVLD